MTRPAAVSDIPMIMEMGKRFADDAGVTDQVGWNDEDVEALLHHLIESDDGVLLVGDRCMIGGIVIDHVFNRHCRVFQELFWRSEGSGGVRLLKEAERIARARGASRFLMLSTELMAPEETGRLYERLGFERGETIYTKRL